MRFADDQEHFLRLPAIYINVTLEKSNELSPAKLLRKETEVIKLKSKHIDAVIAAPYLTGITNYEYALKKLVPLINKLDIQRTIQNEKFYNRLESDIVNGCIMPPLTLAFIHKSTLEKKSMSFLQSYVDKNIKNAFVLDGIQRLNTLKRASENYEIDLSSPLFINIIICSSRDNLLYRMITLNNGQKPMTARHQIEILASNVYNFDKLGLNIVTEKEFKKDKPKDAFKKSDIISAYIAFLSNTTNLESSKIIQEKMDELIARKIIETSPSDHRIEFSDILILVARFSKNKVNYRWLKNLNNLMGFCVGIKRSYSAVARLSASDFASRVSLFEGAFSNLDVSKIKLSRERRKLSRHLFENYLTLKDADEDELTLIFNELE